MIEAVKAAPGLMAALKGGRSPPQLSTKIAEILDSHPKTKKNAMKDRKAKIDIIKNAVHEHFGQTNGGSVSTNNHIPIIQGSESSIANESTLVNQFAMTNLSKSDPFHEFASDSMRVKGVEYLGAISIESNAGIGNTVYAIQFNPLTWSGTRLARYATMFNYFRFEDVEIIYEPIVSKMTSGSMVAAILPNVARQIPSSGVEGLRATMELRNAIMFPVYQVQTMTYKFSTPTAPLLCVNPSPASGPNASTLSNQGTLFFKDASGLADNTYGQVVVKYRICFYDSCIGSVPVNDVPDYSGSITIQANAATGYEGLVTCTSTGFVTAKDFVRYGYMFVTSDVVFSCGVRWGAFEPIWFKIPKASTGSGTTFYPTLLDALAGEGNGYWCPGTPAITLDVKMKIFSNDHFFEGLKRETELGTLVSSRSVTPQVARLKAFMKGKASSESDPSWSDTSKQQRY